MGVLNIKPSQNPKAGAVRPQSPHAASQQVRPQQPAQAPATSTPQAEKSSGSQPAQTTVQTTLPTPPSSAAATVPDAPPSTLNPTPSIENDEAQVTELAHSIASDLEAKLSSVRDTFGELFAALSLIPQHSHSLKPITLEDSHRQQIEKLCGGPILSTPDDVVTEFLKMASLDVDGFKTRLVIPHDVLVRLESRCPIDTDLGEWVLDEFLRFAQMMVDGAL
jgi:hypothetical protein